MAAPARGDHRWAAVAATTGAAVAAAVAAATTGDEAAVAEEGTRELPTYWSGPETRGPPTEPLSRDSLPQPAGKT
jgi:hypothetical protein